MAGSHSAQLYLAPPPSTSTSLYHPEHSLGGIASLPGLSVGETRSATIKVDKRGLAHWDDIIHSWTVEEGKWSAWLSTDSLGPRVCAVAFNVEQIYEWLGL